MEQFEGKTAVITGAASGIGKALAERFAQEKMQVVLADIEEDALEKIEAGADLVQIYTGFVYEGPNLVKRINKAILNKK